MDIAEYSTVLFMDSMVALEGKPLPTLPWKEIDPAGPILILVVPQVMKEIDKRKRDGRLQKRAREFNRLLGPAAESAAPRAITEGPPRVDIGFATCDRIDWNNLDDLDPDEPDARVVAQVLSARGVPHAQKIFLSYDNNPIAMAARHGVTVRKLPERWLLEPEPSPNEKELSKLRRRVAELEASEPDMQATCAFVSHQALVLYRVAPLSDELQAKRVKAVLQANPKSTEDFLTRLDYGYDGRYEKYQKIRVPLYAANLHRNVETYFSQIPFTLTVSNAGDVQAENLIVTLSAAYGGLHSKFKCPSVFGPVAPYPKLHSFASVKNIMQMVREPVGRHEMNFAIGPNGGDTLEIHCADFRHGREWHFKGVARVDPYGASPFSIEIEITAANQRGLRKQAVTIPFDTRMVRIEELVDIDGRKWLMEFPMSEQFEAAIAQRDRDWLDFHEADDD